MSQSKHASDECNPYITLYDNFDPLYGNFLGCEYSQRYYYLPRPPGGDGSIPQVGTPFTPNPVSPIRTTGPNLTSGTGIYVPNINVNSAIAAAGVNDAPSPTTTAP